MTTKFLEPTPASMNTYLEYVNPLKNQSVLKAKDATKMPDGKDFNTNIKNDSLSKSNFSKKIFIQPVQDNEKSGPKWGSNSVVVKA